MTIKGKPSYQDADVDDVQYSTLVRLAAIEVAASQARQLGNTEQSWRRASLGISSAVAKLHRAMPKTVEEDLLPDRGDAFDDEVARAPRDHRSGSSDRGGDGNSGGRGATAATAAAAAAARRRRQRPQEAQKRCGETGHLKANCQEGKPSGAGAQKPGGKKAGGKKSG